VGLKKKPIIIKFNKEDEKQKFHNWALEKSQSSNEINKAKKAMLLAQRNIELSSKRSELTEEVGIKVSTGFHSNPSTTSTAIKTSSDKPKLQNSHVKEKKDGTNAFTTNNRRG